MPSLGSIYVDLEARTAKYDAGLKKGKSATSDFQRAVNSAVGKASAAFNVLALSTAAVGTAAIASFGILAKNALSSADAVAKMSDKLNLSISNVQKFQYAAQLSGVEVEKFEAAIGFLNNQIADGKVAYKDTSTAILDIADRVANAKSGIEKAGIVSEAFGAKLGRSLLPLLKDGSAGVQALAQEAEALGLVLGDDVVRNAEKMSDQIDILGQVITKNFQAEFLASFVGESGSLRDIYTDPQFVEGVRNIGAAFGTIASAVTDAVKLFGEAKNRLTELAAFGIKFGSDLKLIDKDVADQALLEAGQRVSGGGSSLKGAPASSGTGITGGDGGGSFVSSKTADKRKEDLKSILDSLTKETTMVDLQVTHYGEKKAAIEAAVRAKEIEFKLSENGIILGKKEKDALQGKLDMLRESSTQLEALQEQTKNNDDIGRQLGLTFSSSFEDAVVGGEKLRDVLKGIAQDALRLFIRKRATEPFGDALSSAFSGGGFLSNLFGGKAAGPNLDGSAGVGGGFFSSLFDSFLGSFDTGIDHVPSDGLAYIHKGEAVLKPDEAAAWRSGSGNSGPVYQIDARGVDGGVVRRLENMLVSLTGQGVIEHRIADAQRRGVLA